MAEQRYLVPFETVTHGSGTARGPKYFAWRFAIAPLAALADAQWELRDYDSESIALVAADVTDEQHAALVAQSDVTEVTT